jgi:hypothetical protein
MHPDPAAFASYQSGYQPFGDGIDILDEVVPACLCIRPKHQTKCQGVGTTGQCREQIRMPASIGFAHLSANPVSSDGSTCTAADKDSDLDWRRQPNLLTAGKAVDGPYTARGKGLDVAAVAIEQDSDQPAALEAV